MSSLDWALLVTAGGEDSSQVAQSSGPRPDDMAQKEHDILNSATAVLRLYLVAHADLMTLAAKLRG